MISPREFYYTYYDRRPGYRSFQQDTITPISSAWLSPAFAHDQERYSRNIKKALLFRPTYSNDYRLDAIFLDLLKNLEPHLQQRLLRIFVAHTSDMTFESYVRDHRCEIDGEIVFINMGLSSLLIRYAEVMASFWMTIEGFRDAPWLIKQLYCDLDMLRKEQEAFRIKSHINDPLEWSENYLSMPFAVRERSLFFSQAGLAFLVAHEAAHYLLGHLNENDDYHEYIRFTFTDIMHSPRRHQMEFHADLFGMLLVSGSLIRVPISDAQNLRVSMFAAFGAQLLFTLLSQQADPFRDIPSHPRILHRYNINANLCQLIMKREEYRMVISLIRGFQKMLFETQGKGLGVTINSDDYVMPWTDDK